MSGSAATTRPANRGRSISTTSKTDTQTPDQAADHALQELTALIRKFENEAQGYTSLDLPMWKTRYGAYDDLARIKEWSAAGGLGIEEW